MKTKALFFIFAMFIALACTRGAPLREAVPEIPVSSQKGVVWDITVSNEVDTKGIKSGWEEGDVVYVFFQNLINAGDGKSAYLELKYENSHWSFTPKNGLDYGSITSGLNASALYFPYGNDMTLSWDDTDGVVFSNERAISSGFLSASTKITVEPGGEFNTIGANFIMQPNADIVRFFIPDEDAEGVAELKGNCIYPFKVSVASDAAMKFYDSKIDYICAIPGFAATVNGDRGWYFYGRARTIGTLFIHLKLADDRRFTLYKTRNALEKGKSYAMPSLDKWQPAGNDKYVKMGGNYWCSYYAYGFDNGHTMADDVFTAGWYYPSEGYLGLSPEQIFPKETEWRNLLSVTNKVELTIFNETFYLLIDNTTESQFPKHLMCRQSNLCKSISYSGLNNFNVRVQGCFSTQSDHRYTVKPILDTLGNKPIYNPPVSGEEDF